MAGVFGVGFRAVNCLDSGDSRALVCFEILF